MTTTDIFHPLTQMKSRTPEECLMAAVLQDAIDVYRHPQGKRHLLRDTEAWFRSADRSWLFSFGHICDRLGLDPHAIRAALEQERLGHMRAA